MCATTGHELVLEVPLKIEKQRNSALKFDIGIFNREKKRYVAFIEYDGYSGHFTDIKQIQNDILKERFCLTVSVKLLRISSKFIFNIRELDNWFFSTNTICYFYPEHYFERNELIKRLDL
jgi:hypothetical protein